MKQLEKDERYMAWLQEIAQETYFDDHQEQSKAEMLARIKVRFFNVGVQIEQLMQQMAEEAVHQEEEEEQEQEEMDPLVKAVLVARDVSMLRPGEKLYIYEEEQCDHEQDQGYEEEEEEEYEYYEEEEEEEDFEQGFEEEEEEEEEEQGFEEEEDEEEEDQHADNPQETIVVDEEESARACVFAFAS